MLRVALLALCSLAFTAAAQPDFNTPSEARGPRQVILIIGDGMDDHQLTIARNYLAGARGTLALDRLPMRGVAQVLTIEDTVDGPSVFVADSANTATSMATGVVTSRGRIATTAGSDQDIPTIIELAEQAGYRTGLVSTASVTDATPAAFAAHINFRLCENPLNMEEVTYSGIYLGHCQQDLKANGGRGSIAEQLADSQVDVILGGGSRHFAPPIESGATSVEALAQANGYTVVTSAAALAAAPVDQRLLGLFSPGTMPVRLRGEHGRSAEKPQPSFLNYLHKYLGNVHLPTPMSCEPNPDFAGLPSLAQMTDAALERLAHRNDRGFFLMIESASIDKQSHERKPCGSIGEVAQLEEALERVLAFEQEHPNTLILVTADHAQAAQLIPNESLFSDYPVPVYSPGKVARIVTPEGRVMAVNYATNNFFMEDHTGANVPVFGNGVAREQVPAFLNQTQVFELSRRYLELD